MPPADLYVCSGDMFDAHPVRAKRPRSGEANRGRVDHLMNDWRLDPVHEARMAIVDAEKFVSDGGFRALLGSPDAPVICVRGNHDFADIGPLFGGCNLVHEFIDNEVIEVCGLKVTGHQGIPYINGCWNDEVQRADLTDRARRMPRADLFLTHYPPSGIGLDGIPPLTYGLDGLLPIILRQAYVPGAMISEDAAALEPVPVRAAHCFGHIHESHGTVQVIDILFSNAATTHNVFDVNPTL